MSAFQKINQLKSSRTLARIFSAFIFVSLPSFASATDYPLTVTDLGGRRVEIKSEPKRVVIQDGRDLFTLAGISAPHWSRTRELRRFQICFFKNGSWGSKDRPPRQPLSAGRSKAARMTELCGAGKSEGPARSAARRRRMARRRSNGADAPSQALGDREPKAALASSARS